MSTNETHRMSQRPSGGSVTVPVLPTARKVASNRGSSTESLATNPTTWIRVVLANGQKMFGAAIVELLNRQEGIHVIDCVQNGLDAVASVRNKDVQVAVLDLFMPGLNGFDAGVLMVRENLVGAVVLISDSYDPGLGARAIRSGFRGYLQKGQAPWELAKAIQVTGRGGVSFPPGLLAESGKDNRDVRKSSRNELALREKQIVQLVAEGMSTKEIGRILHISTRTADHYRERAMHKLDIHNVADLTRYAIRERLVRP